MLARDHFTYAVAVDGSPLFCGDAGRCEAANASPTPTGARKKKEHAGAAAACCLLLSATFSVQCMLLPVTLCVCVLLPPPLLLVLAKQASQPARRL